jgi:HAD superfamily hydrolase (TIGR01450 family)
MRGARRKLIIMDDKEQIFERYEALRHRLPNADFAQQAHKVQSLLDITDSIDAFVFDAFGVLNIGENPIPGAGDRLDQLRLAGKQIRILSNAASYNHERATEKFHKLGININPEEVITSRTSAIQGLAPIMWGCIAAPSDDLCDIPAETLRLGDDKADYDRVGGILFLSTETWNETRQAILSESLLQNNRPVRIANADIAAPRGLEFSLEPGQFGHSLVDLGLPDVRFFGKPFPEVFDMVNESLAGIDPKRIVMCGDTLHTDILGAMAYGWKAVLVERDGMFCGANAADFIKRSAIVPTWRVDRI